MPDTAGDDVPQTTPRELHRRLRDGRPSVLDLRDRDEVDRWPIPGAEVAHVPYPRAVQAHLDGAMADLAGDLAEPVVVVCPAGEASAEVAGLLRESGVEATNLAGGMDAWAGLLVATELDGPPGVSRVVQYERPATGCLSYLVHDGAAGAVVDPLRAFADRYVDDAADRDVALRYAVDTHVHADHVSGVRAVADRSGAEVVLPAGADERGLSFAAATVADGESLAVGDVDLAAVAAPGHTSEMTALRVDAAGTAAPVLLAGDSLFVDGVARPDLEDPDEAEQFAGRLYETLHERLLPMAGATVVAPGHRGPGATPADDGTVTATLDALAVRLDALSMDREAFVAHVTGDVPPRPANHERIVAVNLGEETVDEETAAELELGPNNCAATGD